VRLALAAFVILAMSGCTLDREGVLDWVPDYEDAGQDQVPLAIDAVQDTVKPHDASAGEVHVPDAPIDHPLPHFDASDASDAPAVQLPCSVPPGPCVAALPVDWALVAFAPALASACPASFQSQDLFFAPVAQAGACDCSCSISQHPRCDVGSLQRYVSSDSSCSNTGIVLTVNGPGCTAWPPSSALLGHSMSIPLG